MSKYSLFMCDKCDFTYEHVDRIFYLNEDLTEITEDTLRIMTSREKTASEISGFIFVWYCIECKEFIYEYDITDNVIFSSSVENTFRKCPICSQKIDSVWNYGKCPACEIGELHLLDKFIFD